MSPIAKEKNKMRRSESRGMKKWCEINKLMNGKTKEAKREFWRGSVNKVS